MKEKPLPKISTIGELVKAMLYRDLTRHYSVGYVLGVDRSTWKDSEKLISHIYKGKYDELEEGMCKRASDKNGYFSIFRNNEGRGICKICLRRTLKELNPTLSHG